MIEIKATNTLTSASNPAGVTNVRTISYQAEPKLGDENQSRITSIAYTKADMTYAHVANAIEEIGGKVIRLEIDAPLREGWEGKDSEIIEDESKLVAWRKGEQIVINKLPEPEVHGTSNIVPFPTQQNVVEIIGISTPQAPKIENNDHDQALFTNPYLTEKAA